MFSVEYGAMERLDQAIDTYEKRFDTIFPLYEYLDETRGNGYDFSIKGCNKLADYIEKLTTPVEVPVGYEERQY